MENRGLLFIPDISGFTRLVNEIEIEHSRHIIQQLLEVIINANESGLEISEIEGDAILFYKFGEPLELEVLTLNTIQFFCNKLSYSIVLWLCHSYVKVSAAWSRKFYFE
jgi:hypothetical protein